MHVKSSSPTQWWSTTAKMVSLTIITSLCNHAVASGMTVFSLGEESSPARSVANASCARGRPCIRPVFSLRSRLFRGRNVESGDVERRFAENAVAVSPRFPTRCVAAGRVSYSRSLARSIATNVKFTSTRRCRRLPRRP